MYCVSHIAFNENNLTHRFVQADNWLEALLKAYPEAYNLETFDDIESPVNNIEDCKQRAFDCDMLFEVTDLDNISVYVPE